MRDKLLEAAETYGTPLYVYDMHRIKSNLKRIEDAFGERVEIHYACKALDNINVLRELRDMGCGIDAVSKEELEIALKCGFEPQDINFTPSGAPFEEYIWAHEHGINIHADNLGILKLLGEYKRNFPVSLRFNPEVRSGGHAHLQVGADDSKFGLFPEELDAAHALIEQYDIQVRRIHVHAGSDIKTVDDFLACWSKAFPLAEKYRETVDMIDLGGGFGVQYFPDDPVLDLAELGAGINALRAEYEASTGHKIKLLLEPGKSIVGDAGYFLLQVTASKELNNRHMVYVNSGFNHMLRPMYYGARHRFENLSTHTGVHEAYKIVGYLCETDTFAEQAFLMPTAPGDILCMHNAGAYAFTMSSNYNARRRPAEVLLKKGRLQLIRRRETLDDILATQMLDG